ncbi:unnamed protein product [Protopolystoma xenopodis]|uniref:Uncharacterized protein n=1 Tax=Protopolystoma xenopodis TaxID=117903 RepID=A0A3S5AZE8_9PLAT|nr:unnamed protein product [Protopolystoma xenopodis]
MHSFRRYIFCITPPRPGSSKRKDMSKNNLLLCVQEIQEDTCIGHLIHCRQRQHYVFPFGLNCSPCRARDPEGRETHGKRFHTQTCYRLSLNFRVQADLSLNRAASLGSRVPSSNPCLRTV